MVRSDQNNYCRCCFGVVVVGCCRIERHTQMYIHHMLTDAIISAQNNNHISTTLRAGLSSGRFISNQQMLKTGHAARINAACEYNRRPHKCTQNILLCTVHRLVVEVETMTCMCVSLCVLAVQPRQRGERRRDVVANPRAKSGEITFGAYGTRLLHCCVCCQAPNSLEPSPPPNHTDVPSSLNYVYLRAWI